MKKTFKLTDEKHKTARIIENIKKEVKKYIKRERSKILPEGYDYWDFDCKFGQNANDSKEIHLTEISKNIDETEKQKLESFYLEILAKPIRRVKKEKPKSEEKEKPELEGTEKTEGK